ncbi:putative reverse transcriptase domain-containing protein, partial [Tanacetum coccineum]
GISFIKSVDASSIESNAENLCNLFSEIVEMVGVKNVVQMVTDNELDNVKEIITLLCRLRQERWSENRKSLQQMLLEIMLDGSAFRSFGHSQCDFLEERTNGNTNIRQCLRKVADEHFTATVKVLSSSGVAAYYDDTIIAR